MRREAPKSCHLLQHRTITNPTKPEKPEYSARNTFHNIQERDTKVPKLLELGLAQVFGHGGNIQGP